MFHARHPLLFGVFLFNSNWTTIPCCVLTPSTRRAAQCRGGQAFRAPRPASASSLRGRRWRETLSLPLSLPLSLFFLSYVPSWLIELMLCSSFLQLVAYRLRSLTHTHTHACISLCAKVSPTGLETHIIQCFLQPSCFIVSWSFSRLPTGGYESREGRRYTQLNYLDTQHASACMYMYAA